MTQAHDPPPGKPGGSAAAEWTAAIAICYSLLLAAGPVYVFYASFRPVSIAEGYGAAFLDYPWILAFLLLAAVWVIGGVLLLVLGLLSLRQRARFAWRLAGGWLCALTGSIAVGFAALHEFRLLFTAYQPDPIDGSPLGPSRFAPGAPYWPALLVAGAQFAICVVMIALNATWSRKPRPGPEPG
jgi:hypothetical protein